jgi:hypothetical protein
MQRREHTRPGSGLTNSRISRARALLALAALTLVAGGCQGDALDPGLEITGPVITLAPHTVSVTVAPGRQVALGGGLAVTVAANAGADGVTSIGATALVLDARGVIVDLMALGTVTFDQPRTGTVVQELRLSPRPGDVNLDALPDTLTYEVHGWVRTGGGACAAAVEATAQRLPCTLVEGQPVAQGQRGQPVVVTVLPPHSVGFTTTAPARLEPQDVVTFLVRAQTRPELGGIQQVGIAARVAGATGAPVDVVLATRDVGGRAEVEESITLTIAQMQARLPAGFAFPADGALTLQPTAFAIHQTGACVAAVQNGLQQLPCAPLPGGRMAAGVVGQPLTVVGVQGRTIPLPNGVTQIGDLLVHTPSQRLFASNLGGNTLEVLNLGNPGAGFSPNAVRVGSRPWGMSFNTDGTHLLVANSGGTNVSVVPTATLQEQRVAIPRVTLYQLEFSDTLGVVLSYFNYADRPRHLAQDAAGRILFSAVGTQAAPEGTIRSLEQHPGTGMWSARLLFPEGLLVNTPPVENRAVSGAQNTIAIANVDSMHLVMAEDGLGRRFATGQVVFFDHPPGRPDLSRGSPPLPFFTPAQRAETMAYMRFTFNSDIVIYEGYEWNFPESVSVADPTFVAASADRQWVAFGEGAAAQLGRIILWGAGNPTLSRVEDIRDILNNTSDVIGGIALNHDGSRGAARGQEGVYFFDRHLRLQGTGGAALAGGSGLAFLPGERPLDQQLVFAGTGRSSIQVIEPVHFRVVREIPIRGNVIGALHAAPPSPGAPAGTIATVYGVTAEGVVMVDIPN